MKPALSCSLVAPIAFAEGGGSSRDPGHGGAADQPAGPSPNRPQPGVAAIGLWMFFLCLIGLLGVSEHKLPRIAVLFCIAFAVAGQGLLRQKRWGWALTLATVFLSGIYGMWMVAHFHQLSMLLMAVVNLILFLYLVRPEVRERMR